MMEPGIYDALSLSEYHRDPALGHSGAVTLLGDCPARFAWEREHPPEPKREFDIGTAVHLAVLQPEQFETMTHVIPFENYRTKVAQELRDAAYMVDCTPLLGPQLLAVDTMASAVRAHPIAGPLLTGGIAEQSLFWRDAETGIMRKCRPDYRVMKMPSMTRGGLSVWHVVNLKTAVSAHPDIVRKTAWDHHWWSSQEWTIAGLNAHEIDVFDYLYVVVEKDPPHFVAVYRLPERMIEMGRLFNRKAVHLYVEYTKTGTWPDYGGKIIDLDAPQWAEHHFEEARVRGDYSLDEIVP